MFLRQQFDATSSDQSVRLISDSSNSTPVKGCPTIKNHAVMETNFVIVELPGSPKLIGSRLTSQEQVSESNPPNQKSSVNKQRVSVVSYKANEIQYYSRPGLTSANAQSITYMGVSIITLVFFNFVFGAVALLFSLRAHRHLLMYKRKPAAVHCLTMAYRYGRYALYLSFTGIIITMFIVIIVFSFFIQFLDPSTL